MVFMKEAKAEERKLIAAHPILLHVWEAFTGKKVLDKMEGLEKKVKTETAEEIMADWCLKTPC